MSIFVISGRVSVARRFFCLRSFWRTLDYFIVSKGKNAESWEIPEACTDTSGFSPK